MESVSVGNTNEDNHSDAPEDGAEDNGEDGEPPVPDMFIMDGGHAQEHEDDGLGGAGQHLHGVLDCCLRLVGHVSLYIILHGDATECDGQNAGHVEYLSAEVGEVGHGEHEHGLQDGGVVGEPGDKASDVAPDDANDCATAGNHDEAGKTLEDVYEFWV